MEEGDLKTMDFDEEIGLVDALLDTYDYNNNGLLEYVEFITAFKESRHQLGIWEYIKVIFSKVPLNI